MKSEPRLDRQRPARSSRSCARSRTTSRCSRRSSAGPPRSPAAVRSRVATRSCWRCAPRIALAPPTSGPTTSSTHGQPGSRTTRSRGWPPVRRPTAGASATACCSAPPTSCTRSNASVTPPGAGCAHSSATRSSSRSRSSSATTPCCRCSRTRWACRSSRGQPSSLPSRFSSPDAVHRAEHPVEVAAALRRRHEPAGRAHRQDLDEREALAARAGSRRRAAACAFVRRPPRGVCTRAARDVGGAVERRDQLGDPDRVAVLRGVAARRACSWCAGRARSWRSCGRRSRRTRRC